jgi:CRP/FNR family cyclic AMP-dependent transcriptional regulator
MNISDWNLALGVLRQANWLKAYPIELAERLLAEGRLVHLNAGEWAQSEGDDRSGLYVVMEGVLHTYCSAPGDRLVMIGLAEAGAVLGHATRFSGGPRLVTAVCVEPCVLLEISEAALERVAESQAGGQGGIRTHGELAPTAVFKTAALNHSATCPCSPPFGRKRSFVQALR